VAGRFFLAAAGVAGAISVAADAVARHVLAADAHRLELATIAARYGLIHAVALTAVVILLQRTGGGAFWVVATGWLFVGGLVLFCGSLDLIALGATPRLSALAPWGGTAFILGWVFLVVAAIRSRPAR
jgi:uncharacterized membrane protein YgdD (TMEM256/DUF423 family)